jgi:Transposase DNA-binding
MKLPFRGRRTRNERPVEDESWVDREVAGCKFQDERLGEKFENCVNRSGTPSAKPCPACQDWAANTKAAYRFFSNDRVRAVGRVGAVSS